MSETGQGILSTQLSSRINSFDKQLLEAGIGSLTRGKVTVLQVNFGRLCNQLCSHCHADAGPSRDETMSREVAEKVGKLVEHSPHVEVVDLTGGAPELNASFKWLVSKSRALGKRVIDRSNLTVFLEPGMESMPGFLASNQVDIVASLPCYTEENVDKQRGAGVFKKSIEALRILNSLGYGSPEPGLVLNLVYNPGGAFLPGPQDALQRDYKEELQKNYGVSFNRLLTITNMPIHRFGEQLSLLGDEDLYMDMLSDSFNPNTVSEVMCRSLVSVGYNGDLYDCDFNQMLKIPLGAIAEGIGCNIFEVESLTSLEGCPIATGSHCLGCTAGAGSSCAGALQ